MNVQGESPALDSQEDEIQAVLTGITRKLEEQKVMEQALSLSYCAAKATVGASVDLLQELSDATDVFPESSTLSDLKILVSRSRNLLHNEGGRTAALLMLQLAFQEPVTTGLPAQVQALRWEDFGQCWGAST